MLVRTFFAPPIGGLNDSEALRVRILNFCAGGDCLWCSGGDAARQMSRETFLFHDAAGFTLLCSLKVWKVY